MHPNRGKGLHRGVLELRCLCSRLWTFAFVNALCLIVLGAVFLGIGPECGAADLTSRPNILLVVTDDMGYGDATCYWKTDLETPVIDGIARRGARFMQFRVNPLCAPTRASIMTGLYSLEAGMWRGPSGRGAEAEDSEERQARPRRLTKGVRLLPEFLKDAGYATGMFGKWHLGYEAENSPNVRGFDEFVGFLGGAHPYWITKNSRIVHNGKPMETTGHTTDLFADRAVEFIKSGKARPFFCYLAFNAVHGPLRNADRSSDSAKPEWLAKYEKKGVEQPRRDYCAVMSHADDRIGHLITTLRELDLERRTLVIVVSDNGGILHTYPSNNGPLRGGKGTTYEGGIRVPAVMQWPGVIPAGLVSRADAAHFDLFSTILDAAGVSMPGKNGAYAITGVSLLPHLRSSGKAPLPARDLFWDLYGQVGALRGTWKLVGEIPNHHGKFNEAIEQVQRARFQLYNLAEDLGEKHDVAEKHPQVYEELKGTHLRWLRQFAR